MSSTQERIVDLLRRARDQQGTPEGDTCAALAKKLMAKTGGPPIELDDDAPPAFGDDLISVAVDNYEHMESWRQHLVVLVQMLYEVIGSWDYDGHVVTLAFSAAPHRARALDEAVAYYLDLQDAIVAAGVRAPPAVQVAGRWMRLDPRDPAVVELFRRGVTDAWCVAISRLLDRHNEEMDAKISVDAQTTALMRQDRIRVAASDDEGSTAAQVPHEAEGANEAGMLIYAHGVVYGQRTYDWPVPEFDVGLDDP